MQQELLSCKLCRQRPANKENSHIIPKFLGKALFDLVSPKHMIVIRKDKANSEKRQDTPKEDHILCSSCEKRMEVVETYFSKRIKEMHAFSNYPDKFGLRGWMLVWKALPAGLFELFFYSIIWRCSISSLYDFKSFRLREQDEETLRSLLDHFLKDTQSQLLNNLPKQSDLPPYHICMLKPVKKTSPPGGMYSVYSYTKDIHLLVLVDFIVFFYTDENSMEHRMKMFSSRNHPQPVTGLMPNEHWQWLNQLLYNQVTDNHKG